MAANYKLVTMRPLPAGQALFQSGTAIKFGLAFCEASGDRKIRFDGNDAALVELAKQNAVAIGAGHSFIIFMKDAFPGECAACGAAGGGAGICGCG